MRAKKADLPVFYTLSGKQQKAVAMLFEGKLKQNEIAKELNVADSTVTKWKRNKWFKEAQDEYNHHMLREYASDAVNTLRSLLKAKSEMVRFNAAKDILDRTGVVTETELQRAQIEKMEVEIESMKISNKDEDTNNWSQLVEEAEKLLGDADG